VQVRFGDDIHTAAQHLLRIQQPSTQSERADPTGQDHQQLDVAAGGAFAALTPAHRAKNPYTRHTTLARQGEQLGAVRLDRRVQARQCLHPVLPAPTPWNRKTAG
jgi:hypothetical protein